MSRITAMEAFRPRPQLLCQEAVSSTRQVLIIVSQQVLNTSRTFAAERTRANETDATLIIRNWPRFMFRAHTWSHYALNEPPWLLTHFDSR